MFMSVYNNVKREIKAMNSGLSSFICVRDMTDFNII